MWPWLESISLIIILQFLTFISRPFFRENNHLKSFTDLSVQGLLVKCINYADFGKSCLFSTLFYRTMQIYTLQEELVELVQKGLHNRPCEYCLKDEIVKLIEKSKLLNFDEKPYYWYSFFTIFFRIIDCFSDKTNKQKLCDRSFFHTLLGYGLFQWQKSN